MSICPVTLQGSRIRLEPLSLQHVSALARAGLYPDLWRLQPKPVASEADMLDYVQTACDDQARGASLPFAVVGLASETVIGSTRFMDIAPAHRRLEIGATWFTPASQRTGANVESKLLLLAHAFETLGMQKVVFKTEALNVQSRTAILALGAIEEGTFRRHLVATDGRMRDMVYFAILDDEWPQVKARLHARLASR
jgi:RimJ/RimL family protein N-acetyltransferase